VDRYLGGRQRVWAVVASYGDNLEVPARRVAAELGLDDGERERLRELGECLNYNAYGDSVDDLHYHPADLFEILNRYRDPRDFIESEPVLEVLRTALADDFERANRKVLHAVFADQFRGGMRQCGQERLHARGQIVERTEHHRPALAFEQRGVGRRALENRAVGRKRTEQRHQPTLLRERFRKRAHHRAIHPGAVLLRQVGNTGVRKDFMSLAKLVCE